MKMYFFSNKSWGMCYTVMAESTEEAKSKVIEHLKKKYDSDVSTYKSMYGSNSKKLQIQLDILENDYKEMSSLEEFVIIEYGVGEILETEYS